MTAYEWYVFFLCLIVFVLLGTLSVVAIAWIVKLTLRLIKVGAEDEKIKIEFEKLANKQPSKFWDGVEKVLSVLFCLVLFIALAFSIACNLQKQSFSSTMPTFRVVRSSSMATKDEENTYLIKNVLNDKFQAFDLILTYKMPEENITVTVNGIDTERFSPDVNADEIRKELDIKDDDKVVVYDNPYGDT